MSSKALAAKIAQPYAEALLAISQAQKSIDSVNEEVKNILNIVADSQQLKAFFSNPLVPVAIQKDIIEKIFASSVSKPILSFLMVLAEKGRLSLLDSVAEKYLELAFQLTNVTVAKVVSAVNLTEEQQQSLIKKIERMTNASKIDLIVQVDQSLIAGLTVQIGSQFIDTSLKGQLKQMAAHLDISL